MAGCNSGSCTEIERRERRERRERERERERRGGGSVGCSALGADAARR